MSECVRIGNMAVGDTLMIGGTQYVVRAIEPYPRGKNKKRICWNFTLSRKDGSGKHQIADFALPAEPQEGG